MGSGQCVLGEKVWPQEGLACTSGTSSLGQRAPTLEKGCVYLESYTYFGALPGQCAELLIALHVSTSEECVDQIVSFKNRVKSQLQAMQWAVLFRMQTLIHAHQCTKLRGSSGAALADDGNDCVAVAGEGSNNQCWAAAEAKSGCNVTLPYSLQSLLSKGHHSNHACSQQLCPVRHTESVTLHTNG